MIFKKPSENAPSFVKGKLSIKCCDFSEFMVNNEKDGWLNIDLLESREGKYYAKLNDYVPNGNKEQQPNAFNTDTSSETQIPF